MTVANQVRQLWLNATEETIEADFAAGLELQKQAPDDPQVRGYVEGLANLKSVFKAP